MVSQERLWVYMYDLVDSLTFVFPLHFLYHIVKVLLQLYLFLYYP